ncbi:MAG: hypothetical protein AB7U29_12830 [Desulfobulbus sp.]
MATWRWLSPVVWTDSCFSKVLWKHWPEKLTERSIGRQMLLIQQWEGEFERFGLKERRIRLDDEKARTVTLSIVGTEFTTVLDVGVRATVVRLLKSRGVDRVLLNWEGRQARIAPWCKRLVEL